MFAHAGSRTLCTTHDCIPIYIHLRIPRGLHVYTPAKPRQVRVFVHAGSYYTPQFDAAGFVVATDSKGTLVEVLLLD